MNLRDALLNLKAAADERGAFANHLSPMKDPKDMERYIMRATVYAISYCLTTGRASASWEKQFTRANPDKLLDYVVKRGGGSNQEIIQKATAYLNRYCKSRDR